MTFLGWLSDLLERLSDLHLGYQKVTWKKLVDGAYGVWYMFQQVIVLRTSVLGSVFDPEGASWTRQF